MSSAKAPARRVVVPCEEIGAFRLWRWGDALAELPPEPPEPPFEPCWLCKETAGGKCFRHIEPKPRRGPRVILEGYEGFRPALLTHCVLRRHEDDQPDGGTTIVRRNKKGRGVAMWASVCSRCVDELLDKIHARQIGDERAKRTGAKPWPAGQPVVGWTALPADPTAILDDEPETGGDTTMTERTER